MSTDNTENLNFEIWLYYTMFFHNRNCAEGKPMFEIQVRHSDVILMYSGFFSTELLQVNQAEPKESGTSSTVTGHPDFPGYVLVLELQFGVGGASGFS